MGEVLRCEYAHASYRPRQHRRLPRTHTRPRPPRTTGRVPPARPGRGGRLAEGEDREHQVHDDCISRGQQGNGGFVQRNAHGAEREEACQRPRPTGAGAPRDAPESGINNHARNFFFLHPPDRTHTFFSPETGILGPRNRVLFSAGKFLARKLETRNSTADGRRQTYTFPDRHFLRPCVTMVATWA